MFSRIGKLLILTVVSVLFLGTVCQGDVSFIVNVDRKIVPVGQQIQLSLIFYGAEDVQPPQISGLKGFNVRYMGPSTRVSIVNGQVSSSITHMYSLVATSVGRFQIGPFSLSYKGGSLTSNALMVEVVNQPANMPGQSPLVPQQMPGHGGDAASQIPDLDERVFVKMELAKTEANIYEEIPVKIKLYVNGMSMRDIQYPEFEHEGFLVNPFGEPKQGPEVYRGTMYNVVEFDTTLFATKSGEFKIGPALIDGNIVVPRNNRPMRSVFEDNFSDDFFDSFFNRIEVYPVSLRSDSYTVKVLDLPEEGKPADFKGAVGDFNMEVAVDKSKVKAGDPITVTTTINGVGNFNTVNTPEMAADEDIKTYDPKVSKQEDGVKIFEQVVIPKKQGIKDLPAVSFSFFNPKTREYKTITEGPFPIQVEKPEREEKARIVEMAGGAQKAVAHEILGRDIIYIKNDLGPLKPKGVYLYQNKVFLALQSVPIILVAFLSLFYMRSERLRSDVRFARKIRASRKARSGMRKIKSYLVRDDRSKFYDSVFKMLQEYLGDKFHLISGGITADIVDLELKSGKIPPEILSKIKDIFSECDMARYALTQLDKTSMEKTFEKLEDVVEYIERARV